MGIVFLLLCLVILYRVWPKSMKKKLNSMECLVDFHGTSLRSLHEIIHVMILHVNLNMPNKQTMFVWQSLSSHHHQPCLSPPPTTLFTTTALMIAHKHQRPHCHHDHPKNEANHPQTKMATHIQRWTNHNHPPQVMNDDQQPCMDMGNDEPRWVSSPPPPNYLSNTGATLCSQMTRHNEGMATTTTWDNDKEGTRQQHSEDTQQQRGHVMLRTCDEDDTRRQHTEMMQDDANTGWCRRWMECLQTRTTTHHPHPWTVTGPPQQWWGPHTMVHKNWWGCTTTTQKQQDEGTPPPPTNNVTSPQHLHPWKTMSPQQHHPQMTMNPQHYAQWMRAPNHHVQMAMRALHHHTPMVNEAPHHHWWTATRAPHH